MKRRWVTAVLAVLITIALLLFLRMKLFRRDMLRSDNNGTRDDSVASPTAPMNPTSMSSPSSPDERRHHAVEIIQSVYSAPIEFYGQVRDQYGVPVPQARVDYSIIDKFFETGSKRLGVTDGQGAFSLGGVTGAALTVGVSKDGYAPIYGESNGSFAYGAPFDTQRDRPSPTKDRPAVFVLRKKAMADPLFVATRDVAIPKDGTPVEFSLRTGKQVPSGQGDLRLECWISDNRKDSRGHYDWRAIISVPGGGILERSDPDREFEAPEHGYKSDIDVTVSQSSPDWQRNHDGEYWVLLHDQSYARMRFRINTAGTHFATIEVFLNPSGSRNLEYDENKVIK